MDKTLKMGMTGIDEESALLKEVRAHQCVKRKKLTDRDNLSAEEAYLLAYGKKFATVQVYN